MECRIKRVGIFGDLFKDPLLSMPDSAVLSGLQPGAYSWHLHILIVDASLNEKHACVLLPDYCDDPWREIGFKISYIMWAMCTGKKVMMKHLWYWEQTRKWRYFTPNLTVGFLHMRALRPYNETCDELIRSCTYRQQFLFQPVSMNSNFVPLSYAFYLENRNTVHRICIYPDNV